MIRKYGHFYTNGPTLVSFKLDKLLVCRGIILTDFFSILRLIQILSLIEL